MSKRLVIAGTGSGAGKTTVTIGLLAALKQKGLNVQGFKCGPDYIDPTYHTAVTGRISRNLDSVMFDHEVLKEIFLNASREADISIIEGVMGFYDGKKPTSNVGSTAEITLITKTPVLLVIQGASIARSAAAIVKGFQMLDSSVHIAGVIANNVGSVSHYKIIKEAIEQECDIPVVGYLLRNPELSIPERHLGLVPSVERGELDAFFDKLGQIVSETIDLEKILEIAEAEALETTSTLFSNIQQTKVKIAVARDEAFNFYYEENLQLLKVRGAELLEFSPLKGEGVPEDVDGLYIGGGFPEEFAKQLSEQKEVLSSFKLAIEKGVPTLAECGGFMFLTEGMITTKGEYFPMVGVLPGKCTMHTKLAALGYRETTSPEGNFLIHSNMVAKGHEFHYSTYESNERLPYAYETKGMRGTKKAGVLKHQLVAGYVHFHFASNPHMVDNWIEASENYKQKREVL